jgi:hypothetical protein
MAGITQQVPNYIFGISEQPDELKVPGQVRDCINGLPDVTRGLQKRSGTVLKGSLGASSSGHWFSIYRDDNEQYIGQVTSGTVRIWDALTGSLKTTQSDSYLNYSDPEDIQVLSVNDYTFLTNRKKVTRMSSSKSPEKVNQAFISLKQIKPGTQYALDVSTPGSGISHTFERATNIEIVSIPDEWTGTSYPGQPKGDCRYAGRQLFSSNNNVWFEIDSRCTSSPIPTDSDNQEYYDVFTNTATLRFGGENQGIGTTHQVTMTNSKENGSWAIRVTAVSPVTARANIALVRPSPTPFEGLGADADSILQGITTPLQAAGFTVKLIGSGIYITRSSPFVVSAPDDTLMTVIQNSADDVSQLPSSCKDGYIVKIANSGEDEDDYYVKFVGDNGDGPGVWEETVAPDLKTSFDASTMPVQLVRQSDGSFNLETTVWENRLVGDNTTNQEPSFVGKTINKIVFFRNRLGILSDENIVLSRPGDFFNFWAKTATTVVPIDPIDLSCSSQTPAVLYEALETNAGLVMFAENQQFLMTTDSDVFSPRTAKINALSTYRYDVKTNPVSLGTTIAFLNQGGPYTRMFEMVGVSRDVEPQLIEQSKLVSKMIPAGYKEIAESKENSFVALASPSNNTVWIYRYLNSGEKRIQSAWVKWTLPGNVLYHVIMEDVYYAVISGSGGITLQSIGIRPNDTYFLADKSAYLDNQVTIPVDNLTFNPSTQTTTFTKPDEFKPTRDVKGFTYDLEARWGSATVEGDQVTLLGDWTTTPLTLGVGYEMLVDFPTIYPQQKQGESVRSDIRSSLVVQRIKLNLEDTNIYKTTLFRRGKADYEHLHESTPSDAYRADAVPFLRDKDQTISVYERNTNMNLRLTSDYPCACTLLSMNWEGDYNPRYYKSV